MPDLTIVYAQQCHKAGTDAQWNVGGYSQYFHIGGLQCTCKGFQFRKKCKHIDEIEHTRCTWHSMYSEPQTEEQEENHVCPECGGETVTVRVAV